MKALQLVGTPLGHMVGCRVVDENCPRSYLALRSRIASYHVWLSFVWGKSAEPYPRFYPEEGAAAIPHVSWHHDVRSWMSIYTFQSRLLY